MFQIKEARLLSPDVKLFRIEAPRIAKRQKAGQFVILRVHGAGERIPLTIAGSNPEDGTITLIVQGIGKTTKMLNLLETGDSIPDLVGPLGKASEIEKFGTAVVIGGGVGTAIAYPTAKALAAAGNEVIAILGARNKELVLLENEMREFCKETHVVTDDGSYGTKGLVTDKLKEIINSGKIVNYILAIGPVPMMRAVGETSRPAGIKTMVSLNPVMVDGTGMCGGCRVVVDGKSAFACVDGPEFDAHLVDFGILISRNNMYRDIETLSLNQFLETPQKPCASGDCRLEKAIVATRES